MKVKNILIYTIISILSVLYNQTVYGEDGKDLSNTFYCDIHDNKPATFMRDELYTFPIIVWLSNDIFQNLNPQQRCEKASLKFEEIFRKGLLNYLTHDKKDGGNVICIAAFPNGSCLDNGILFFLNPDTQPDIALAHLTEEH